MLKLSSALMPLLQAGLPHEIQHAVLALLMGPTDDDTTPDLLDALRDHSFAGVDHELAEPVREALRAATVREALEPDSPWQHLVENEILDLDAPSVVGAVTVALLLKADALVASLRDASEDEISGVYEAAAHQARVFYFG